MQQSVSRLAAVGAFLLPIMAMFTGSHRSTAAAPATRTDVVQAKKVADETEALSWLASGDFYQKDLSSAYPNGSKGQVYAGEYNMTGSINGISATIKITAAYTDRDVYFQLQWTDPTKTNDLNRRRSLFNGPGEGGVGTVPGWSSQLNDDKFAMAWDVKGAADGTGTFQQKGCTVGCHDEMNPPQGVMDIWHFKTSRSNPLGYVNDQYGDATGRHTDAGDPIEVRNLRDPNDISKGPKFVWDPTKGKQLFVLPNPAEGSNELDPALFLLKSNVTELKGDAKAGDFTVTNVCASCHDFNGADNKVIRDWGLNKTDAQIATWLKDPAHPGSGDAASLSATDVTDVIARIRGFTGVPGYYLQQPTGSAADIIVLNSKTIYKDGVYTVQIRRPLNSGHPDDDVQFDPLNTKEYPFGVAVMDKDGKNHAGSAYNILRFVD